MRRGRPLWTILSLRAAAGASSFASRRRLQANSKGGSFNVRRSCPHSKLRVRQGIAQGTKLVRPPEGGPKAHGAVGRGPFGQLTMMGLLQMIGLGERLREELGHLQDEDEGNATTDESHQFVNQGRLFTPQKPLHPSRVQVMSTDFPRTIQSVQALLTGLFPDAGTEEPVKIDLRHTNSYFIPDPQPRQSAEQLRLESHLSKRAHMQEREEELKELAHRVTAALDEHLGEGAKGVSFGVGEEKDANTKSTKRQPLAWAQMAEVLTCLHSRELLPPTLSEEEVQAVSNHAAWRWFENLRHPVLANSAMWKFASRLVDTMQRRVDIECRCQACIDGGGTELVVRDEEEYEQECVEEPWLCIFSAHDSTLIGALCIFQLEMPSKWPEYGSALKVELIREEDESQPTKVLQHWIRFSLNGQVLRSTWLADEDGEPSTMVPLNELADMIDSEHELFEEGKDGSGMKYSWKDGLLREH
ncbi:hypothetical protein ACHAXT_012483 [Thalassiosira profunda]